MKLTFSQQFENSLKISGLIKPKQKVFVACSGGPDSVALFHLLQEISEKWKLKLGLLHLNHGLRGKEANADERFVRQLAKKYRVSFYSTKKKISVSAKKNKESIEEAARKARYSFFEKIAKKHKIKRIMLAHNQDDQAETVLMRLLQGTGVRGLSGIRRVLKKGNVTYSRPLIDFTKAEILTYLKRKQIAYRKDKSNESMRFMRNKIRKKLIPLIQKEINPKAVQALARIPMIVEEENRVLSDIETKAFKKSLKRKAKQQIDLKRAFFSELAAPLQFRVLNQALHKIDPRSGLDFEAWNRLRADLWRKRFRTSVPKDIDISLSPSKVSIYKKYA